MDQALKVGRVGMLAEIHKTEVHATGKAGQQNDQEKPAKHAVRSGKRGHENSFPSWDAVNSIDQHAKCQWAFDEG
jgi:hypothetical protein